MTYRVLLAATENDRRDYRARQLWANEQKATAYVEFHFNAKRYDKPGFEDNPASCLVADNASDKSKALARDYAKAIATEFGFPNRGMVELSQGDRGYWNLYYTNMKAILVEPLYVSDKDQAELALSEAGQRRIASVTADVLKQHFPDPATFVFSLGHKYKATSKMDRGAPVVVDFNEEGDPIYHPTMAEADCAERVMLFTKALLEGNGEELPPSSGILLEGEWILSSESGIQLRRKT